MDQKLWEIIKLIAVQKELGKDEMVISYENLDADVFFVLNEHMEKRLHMKSDQWI